MIFIAIFALIAVLFAYGIVKFCHTPKEETEIRKNYKTLIIITSVLLGIIIVGSLCISFLFMIAITNM